MRVLLEVGVEVAFLTKGVAGERFIELFARTPHLTFAQVGITTLQCSLSAKIEPDAASPSQRLSGIASLTRVGVSVTARLDPLIPDVTDTRESLVTLLSELRRVDIGAAAARHCLQTKHSSVLSATQAGGRSQTRKVGNADGNPLSVQLWRMRL